LCFLLILFVSILYVKQKKKPIFDSFVLIFYVKSNGNSPQLIVIVYLLRFSCHFVNRLYRIFDFVVMHYGIEWGKRQKVFHKIFYCTNILTINSIFLNKLNSLPHTSQKNVINIVVGLQNCTYCNTLSRSFKVALAGLPLKPIASKISKALSVANTSWSSFLSLHCRPFRDNLAINYYYIIELIS